MKKRLTNSERVDEFVVLFGKKAKNALYCSEKLPLFPWHVHVWSCHVDHDHIFDIILGIDRYPINSVTEEDIYVRIALDYQKSNKNHKLINIDDYDFEEVCDYLEKEYEGRMINTAASYVESIENMERKVLKIRR